MSPRLSPRQRRLVKWIGYPVYALAVFIVFIYITFPYDRIKRVVEDRLSASGEMLVSIGSMGPAPLLGVTAEEVEIRFRPAPARRGLAIPGRAGAATSAEKKKKKPTLLRLERVKLKAGLLSLLGGGTDLSFDVLGLGGELSGSYSAEKKAGWQLDLKLEGVDARQIPQLQSLGPPLTGALTGKVSLKVPKNRLSNADGTIEIECARCAVGDNKAKLKIPGNVMLQQGITIPKVRIGRLGGRMTVKKGLVTFERFTARSPDIELQLEGSLNLRQPAAFSVIQAYITFKLAAPLVKKHAAFQLLQGQLARGKRPDGSYGLLIRGVLRSPKAVASRVGLGTRHTNRPGAARSTRSRTTRGRSGRSVRSVRRAVPGRRTRYAADPEQGSGPRRRPQRGGERRKTYRATRRPPWSIRR